MSEAIGQFDMSRGHAYHMIEGARVRPMLPEASSHDDAREPAWTEWQVRQLCRLDTDKKIVQVANRRGG